MVGWCHRGQWVARYRCTDESGAIPPHYRAKRWSEACRTDCVVKRLSTFGVKTLLPLYSCSCLRIEPSWIDSNHGYGKFRPKLVYVPATGMTWGGECKGLSARRRMSCGERLSVLCAATSMGAYCLEVSLFRDILLTTCREYCPMRAD